MAPIAAPRARRSLWRYRAVVVRLAWCIEAAMSFFGYACIGQGRPVAVARAVENRSLALVIHVGEEIAVLTMLAFLVADTLLGDPRRAGRELLRVRLPALHEFRLGRHRGRPRQLQENSVVSAAPPYTGGYAISAFGKDLGEMGDTGLEPVTSSVSCHPIAWQQLPKKLGISGS
jgi:hypothetical protein